MDKISSDNEFIHQIIKERSQIEVSLLSQIVLYWRTITIIWVSVFVAALIFGGWLNRAYPDGINLPSWVNFLKVAGLWIYILIIGGIAWSFNRWGKYSHLKTSAIERKKLVDNRYR
jgi:hypothetical protein